MGGRRISDSAAKPEIEVDITNDGFEVQANDPGNKILINMGIKMCLGLGVAINTTGTTTSSSDYVYELKYTQLESKRAQAARVTGFMRKLKAKLQKDFQENWTEESDATFEMLFKEL